MTKMIDADFYNNNRYEMNLEAVLHAVRQQGSKSVFVCGSVNNRKLFLPFCRKAFYLKCSPAKLMDRLNNPDRKYAKSADHQNKIVKSMERSNTAFEGDGIMPVNADNPLNQVVDEIISRSVAD